LEKRKRETNTTKRKILRLEDANDLSSGSEEEGETIDELEFRIKHKPEMILAESDVTMLSVKQLTVMKLIMCSGMYPNIAIPDEANYSRPPLEQVFHTKSKRLRVYNLRFVRLLPNSVFTYNPELLQGEEREPASGIGTALENLHAKRTQTECLFYVELLETTKPYLLNPTKVSLLPVALLFAKRLDLNHNMTVLIVDEWIEIEFDDVKSAEVNSSLIREL
jgi:hypothetical protein